MDTTIGMWWSSRIPESSDSDANGFAVFEVTSRKVVSQGFLKLSFEVDHFESPVFISIRIN